MSGPTDAWQVLLADAVQQPYQYDWYQLMRRYDGYHASLPRLGDADRPSEEKLRLAQEPSLTFAPSNVSSVDTNAAGLPRISVRFLGLFGPNGALPTHVTEFARLRMRSHGDATHARFADIFHHRLLTLFYRAWRMAQPAASHDRPAQDRFRNYLGSLHGAGDQAWFDRDSVQDHAKHHFAGHLARSARNADGLQSILSGYFRVPVTVETFVAGWLEVPPQERSLLGNRASSGLGESTVLGARIRDCQHQIELRFGPLTLAQYTRFLPGGDALARLRSWVVNYTADEFRWRVRLLLEEREVPAAQLGRHGQLGRTCWLGRRRAGAGPAADLALQVDHSDRPMTAETHRPAVARPPVEQPIPANWAA